MDLRTYIERKGGRLNRAHPEVARLARRVKLSAYTLYMVALGHKKLALRTAIALVEITGGEVDGISLCDAFPAALRSQPDKDAA